jgi:hypothetical protein
MGPPRAYSQQQLTPLTTADAPAVLAVGLALRHGAAGGVSAAATPQDELSAWAITSRHHAAAAAARLTPLQARSVHAALDRLLPPHDVPRDRYGRPSRVRASWLAGRRTV